MKFLATALCVSCISFAAPAFAEFEQVTSRNDFMSLVGGKTLSRPLVKISLSSDGSISGSGASWPIEGQWKWQGEYLCRSLEWGGDDLGYNCQEVKVKGNRVRITSDKGVGQSADFRLR